VVLAACDVELLGKRWKDGKRRLSSPKSFYCDETTPDPDELVNIMETCTQANVIGEHAIKAFITGGFINSDSVYKIEGVPYAIFVRMI